MRTAPVKSNGHRRDAAAAPPERIDATPGRFVSRSDVERLNFSNLSYVEPRGAASIDGRNGAGRAGETGASARLDRLIEAYRRYGHLLATLDPLGAPPPGSPEIRIAARDLTECDRRTTIGGRFGGRNERWTIGAWLARLQRAYCSSIGAEFMHLADRERRTWFAAALEQQSAPRPDDGGDSRILDDLVRAQSFERFVRKRFIGAKTFSLEGADSLVPLLSSMIEKAGVSRIEHLFLGMAHRGRLNILANIIGKDLALIFHELLDEDPSAHIGGGDVKYHLGACGVRRTQSGADVRLSLCFNPSHLEFVNPVAMGRTRAARDRGRNACCILIHGDAAVIGEGVVAEALNLAGLHGYNVGGTMHIVVNNQIGFTTTPSEARSTRYCTDLMLGFDIPVLHVNGDDPLAVVRAGSIAMSYRERYGRDVAIDLCCYRRLGHNEIDEPAFTQPVIYRAICAHPTVCEIFLQRSGAAEGRESARALEQDLHERYEQSLEKAKRGGNAMHDDDGVALSATYFGGRVADADHVQTAAPLERLQSILHVLSAVPDGFQLNEKIAHGLEKRRDMAQQQAPLDWASAEALALGSLSMEGVPIRFSGQDTVRGTFGQRHLAWFDTETGQPYTPLQHLAPSQAPLTLINSPLSEAAPLAYEFGYGLDRPDAFVAWEAQYGDFANAAQVIIDQFLASAEDKWERLNGLTLLLPHGFEGSGPEHSSARLERFLLLAAEDNLQITQPTTPAQYFHVLRRQALHRWRKPLIVLTPKSLLRHQRVVSDLIECARGCFQPVLGDPQLETRGGACKRVLLCSGKVYYDLLENRDRGAREDLIAIVRLEQLYPFPQGELGAALRHVPDGTPLKWVQEEPENMGAWRFMRARHGPRLLERFEMGLIARCESASPATGSASSHRLEQHQLIERALAID